MIERKELASCKPRWSFYFPSLHNRKSPLSSVRPEYYPIYVTEYLLDVYTLFNDKINIWNDYDSTSLISIPITCVHNYLMHLLNIHLLQVDV